MRPRQELADLTAEALKRGLTTGELLSLRRLGDDGYGLVAQLELIYVWLERHPATKRA